MNQHRPKLIGELNGPWAFLFKITQVAIPILIATLIPWCVWVTNTLYRDEVRISKLEEFKQVGPRFTQLDADNLRIRIMADVMCELGKSKTDIAAELKQLTIAIQELKLEMTRHMAAGK